jgi:hypothetical protein
MVDVINMVRANGFAQYDGTNGAGIVAKFNGTVVSDDGTTLLFSPDGAPEAVLTATVGQWVWWQDASGPMAPMGATDALPGFPYVVLPS